MSTLLLIFVIQMLFLNQSKSAKILAVFPIPSISHQLVFRPLTKKLAELGHHVTVVTPDPAFSKDNAPPNLTELDMHDISYKIWQDTFMKMSKGSTSHMETQVEIFIEASTMVLDAQLETAEVQKLIQDKNNTYDLILIEASIRTSVIFSHFFKAPVIAISSFGVMPWSNKAIGGPEHPILYPYCFQTRNYNLTMWEKITEIYNAYRIKKIVDNKIEFENNILKKRFGPDIPRVKELINSVDLLFLNTYPIFDGIRPMPPNVIHLGGLHQTPTKVLPSDLKKYLDSSKHGVIYVSFGTNVDSNLLPKNMVQTLMRVFSKLPYNVLLKWDDEKLSGRYKNIKISKWLPQADLLKHPNVKLFITQGGLQSTDEAITAGVPMIGLPMLGDQWYNTNKYVLHKIGIQLDLETLTDELLNNSIHHIIEDKSYRHNLAKLHALMTDQPMTPLERAIWWIEYVLRHGGAKHLRLAAADMSWWQYLEIDIVLAILSTLILLLSICFMCIYFMYQKLKIIIKVKTF